VEVIDFVLVLCSSLLVAVSTLDDLPTRLYQLIQTVQDGIAVVFVAEFVLRWFSFVSESTPSNNIKQQSNNEDGLVNGRSIPSAESTSSSSLQPAAIAPPQPTSTLKQIYLTKPMVLIDLLVVVLPAVLAILQLEETIDWLPTWLTSSGALINLRLLRILRLQRILQDFDTFQKFERTIGIQAGVKEWQLQLSRVVLSIFTLLSVSTGLIYTTEHKVNPNIDNYFSALYFGLTTLTTVGFGDITPVTWQGRLVVSVSILAGVTVIPAQCAALIDALLERQEENNATRAAAAAAAAAKSSTRTTTATSAVASSISSLDATRVANAQDDLQVMRRNSGSGKIVLETSLACPHCQALMHWSQARYCWSCGSRLAMTDDQLEDEEWLM